MKIKSVIVGCVLMMTMLARAASTNDLAGALRNGLFQEQVDHNLPAAIATYQSVVTHFDADRQLAGTAAFRLGECYRAEGKTNEAIAQYQRVVTDFSDQAALVKLSTQNLAELGGERAGRLPLGSAAAGVTNDFNARLQAVLERSRTQQSQDELGHMQTEYTANAAILARLKDLNPDQLQQQLPNISPDPILMNLLDQLNLAEQKFIQVKGDVVPEHPDYKTAKAAVDDLQKKVTDKMAGNLAAMETRLAALKAQIDELKKNSSTMSPEAQVVQLEAQRQTYSNLTQPTTSDEEQEIVRIEAMIQNSPDLINAVSKEDGGTPLIAAARRDHLQVAKFLLTHGADANARGDFQETALIGAAATGHKAMVELLLTNGADANVKWGRRPGIDNTATPLDVAVDKNYPAVVEVLLAHGADPNIPGNDGLTPLFRAVHNETKGLVEALIAHGADVNAKDTQENTALHTAAEGKDPAIASLLLSKKADVNARNQSGLTPLHFAADKNRTNIIKLFLDNGAELNARDKEGRTPLLFAAMDKRAEAANVLLNARADANLACNAEDNMSGWAPLHYAVKNNTTTIAEALLGHGANPDTLTGKYYGQGNAWYSGTTPLTLAIDNKRPDAVALLLRYKADPNLSDAEGIVPLHRAIGQTNMVDALLRAGADVNKPFKDGFTPLQWAVYKGDMGTIEMMLAHKPDVNAVGPNGFTALDLNRNQPWVDRTLPNAIAALLRAHGALDNLPKHNIIQVSRPSAKFSTTVFKKGTNDWNHYTLLELLAVHYGFISTSQANELSTVYFDQDSVISKDGLIFPDLANVKIWRPTETGNEAQAQAVNVEEILNSGDCTKDIELKWGDVVEIPEADHPIDAKWGGLTRVARTMLQNCLTRSVQLTVKGQATNLVLTPITFAGSTAPPKPYGWNMKASTRFSLWPVLNNSGLLRTSSDLSRVQVTRTDAKTGKKEKLTVDCSDPKSPPDLWLRDGDVIEVPER